VFVPPVPPGPSQSHAPGPFFSGLPITPVALFEFHPSLMLREEYSDNFFLEPGRGVSNFRTTIGPGFTALANTAKTQGAASARLDVAFDTAEDTRRQNFFPNISASVQHTPEPRLRLSLIETLASGDDSSQSDRTGIRAAERRQYYTNSLTLAADWQIDQIATRAYYANSFSIGSSTSGASQNLDDRQVSHVLGLGASAPVGITNTVRVGYELSLSQGSTDSLGHFFTASFFRQLSLYSTAGISTSYSVQSRDNSTVWNVSLFTAYGLPTGFSVSGSLGYSRFTSDSGNDGSGVSTNTTISYVFGRVYTSLSVFQDYRQTFTTGEDVGIVLTRTVSATVSAPITAATSGSLTGSYSENEPTGSGNDRNNNTSKFLSGTASIGSLYFSAGVRVTHGENQLIGPINEPTGQARRTLTYGAFVNVPIATWLGLMLDYNYLKRTDISGRGDVKENRVSATLQATF
jgi:hypothetical protein